MSAANGNGPGGRPVNQATGEPLNLHWWDRP
jgi:hypothetical protein